MITVIICTRNRRESLMRTLKSVAAQDYDGAWELVVVDNGCDDGTDEAVAALAAGFPVPLRVVREDKIGLGHARNAGLVAAKGEIVLLTDDDVDCHPGWLAAHARAFSEESVAATGGRIVPVLPEDAPAWLTTLLPHEVGGPLARFDFGDRPCDVASAEIPSPPVGANCGLRVSALGEGAQGGGGAFVTHFGWGVKRVPGVETELFQRLRRQGWRMVYVPDAIVDHRVFEQRLSWDYYLRWQRGFGRSRVIIRPPKGSLDCARIVAKDTAKLLANVVRVTRARLRGDEAARLIGLRKRARLQGRLLELLGL